MESRLDELTKCITGSSAPDCYTSQRNGAHEHPELTMEHEKGSFSHVPVIASLSGEEYAPPPIQLHVLRRLPCDDSCHCSCHRAQRYASPGVLEKVLGKLFLGYAGLPTLFGKCNALGCRQRSSKLAKMTYRFPRWFWYRAVNVGFSYTPATGPELLLRFPCVRPAQCDWFIFARMGDAEGLKRLLTQKQASSMLHYLQLLRVSSQLTRS